MVTKHHWQGGLPIKSKRKTSKPVRNGFVCEPVLNSAHGLIPGTPGRMVSRGLGLPWINGRRTRHHFYFFCKSEHARQKTGHQDVVKVTRPILLLTISEWRRIADRPLAPVERIAPAAASFAGGQIGARIMSTRIQPKTVRIAFSYILFFLCSRLLYQFLATF